MADWGGIVGSAIAGFAGGAADQALAYNIEQQKQEALRQRDILMSQLQVNAAKQINADRIAQENANATSAEGIAARKQINSEKTQQAIDQATGTGELGQRQAAAAASNAQAAEANARAKEIPLDSQSARDLQAAQAAADRSRSNLDAVMAQNAKDAAKLPDGVRVALDNNRTEMLSLTQQVKDAQATLRNPSAAPEDQTQARQFLAGNPLQRVQDLHDQIDSTLKGLGFKLADVPARAAPVPGDQDWAAYRRAKAAGDTDAMRAFAEHFPGFLPKGEENVSVDRGRNSSAGQRDRSTPRGGGGGRF